MQMGPSGRAKAGLAVTYAGVSLLHCWLTWLTHQQFGWRVHSKINCDFRLKNAELKQRLYFQINKWVGVLGQGQLHHAPGRQRQVCQLSRIDAS
jgi:hypothetical protein